MSNLSLIFCNINESEHREAAEGEITYWNNPVNTLVHLMSQCSGTTVDQWLANPHLNRLVHQSINCSISYCELMQFIQSSSLCNKVALMFTEIIVEDLTKFQSRKNRMTKVYEVVHEHLYISTMAIINSNLAALHNPDDMLYSCINAWICYISMARNVSSHGRMDLSEMFDNLINVMCKSTEETDNFIQAEKVLDTIANVFANDPTLMSYELREKMEVIFLGVSRSGTADISKHTWMLKYMNNLVTHQMSDELKELAICMVDFLQINTLDVCNKLFTNISESSINHENLQQYVKVLLQMTNFPLTPVLEESFSVRMVDFWLDLAEAYTNLSSETISPHGPQLATEIFQQVVNIFLPKVSLLNKQKIMQDDTDDATVHEFDDFRAAVSDLVESLWSILGNDKLTNNLINGVGNTTFSSDNGQDCDVYEIEAMSFLLNTLLTDMTLSESPWICDVLDSCGFFVKNVLMLLQTGYESVGDTQIAKTLKLDFVRTSTTLLGTLAGYFQQSPAQLSACINALFQGLEKCTVDDIGNDQEVKDKLEVLTIKSISILCDSCRQELSSYLAQFFNVLNTIMRPDSNVSNFTREKLVRSIGFIIEGLVEMGPEEQAKYILQLINMIENFVQQVSHSTTKDPQQRRNYILCLLSCISELGSSLIHPGEVDNLVFLQKLAEFQDFWKRDPQQIRTKILNLLLHTINDSDYSKDSGFVEVNCLILGKSLTLSDEEPHFLNYSMSEIMNFILEQIGCTDISSSLPYYVYLLERLVNQFKGQLTPQDFDFIFENFFLRYYQQSIIHDPDLLQTTINFINTILDSKPSLVINSTHWNAFILPEFLKFLSAREKFTIVAITKFWVKVLNNKKYTQEDLATTQQQVISMGQELVSQTMFGLYHTQRSDLNSYTDLLRALVAKFPMQIKDWLIAVLPKICNNNAAHEKFISRLSVTRGNRAAGNVILEWWLQCNDLPTL